MAWTPPLTRAERRNLTPEQKTHLEELLAKVDRRTIVQYSWKSEAGQRFLSEARRIQLTNVPLLWMAEALGISDSLLDGAVSYWTRVSGARGSVTRLQREARTAKRRKLLADIEAQAGQAGKRDPA